VTTEAGLLLVDKPAGATSHDIVLRIRRKLGLRRVGHTGTLDPFATGLLLSLVGSFTRLADLYHGRWSIEELYKVSKQTIAVDQFHGRTERGVRQELYAHFNLIAMTRLFSGPGDALLAQTREKDQERQTVNFRNALAIVAASLEEMILGQVQAVAKAVARMTEGMLRVRSRLRPGRSYPRKSMKPVNKWNRSRYAS